MKNTSSVPLYFLVVVGVRPQYIKAVALNRLILKHNETSDQPIKLLFVDTAQHYSEVLKPEFLTLESVHLQHRLSHSTQDPFGIFSNSLHLLGRYVQGYSDRLNGMIVMGDANPTLVGALVAAKLNKPLIHLEAGAKRDPREQEEKNRRVADCLASARFCVSQRAVEVLRAEGLPSGNILTGDLWYDFLAETASEIRNAEGGVTQRDYVLVTIHRPHNLAEETLAAIVRALERSGRAVRWIVHPRSSAKVRSLCDVKSQFVIENPLSYREMVRSVLQSSYVLTDSGGLIREAHHLQRRVLVRRDVGGWDELIEAGYNWRIGRTTEDVEAGLNWAESSCASPYPVSSLLRVDGGSLLAMNALLDL